MGPVSAAPEPEPLNRRERVRLTTIAEIKQLAWAQIAEGGAEAVSLRAISRSMGMTSSAIYRYFDSQEQLLIALICDGFASLADDLEAAEAAVPEGAGPGQQFLLVTGAHRRWALEHPTEYALMYGRPLCAPKIDGRIKTEHDRGVAVLFRVMVAGLAAGAIDPTRMPPLSAELRRRFEDWRDEQGLPLSAEALSACMFAWAQMHGAISLELFAQLPDFLIPADDLFDQQMRAVLAGLGCPASAPTTGRR